MPLTIITLKRATPSLRGDLSKWMQEIATGVYIGNFNSRIREFLWERVMDSVGDGEATLTYASRNEIGYEFRTLNTSQQVIYYDGLPLVFYPSGEEKTRDDEVKHGFSLTAKMRKAKIYTNPKHKNPEKPTFIVLDIETDGLNVQQNAILEIGALKVEGNQIQTFQKLIETGKKVPKKIRDITGIDNELLEREGIEIEKALKELVQFVEDYPIVGYNINFDMKFINHALRIRQEKILSNRVIDIQHLVKKEKVLLKNYKLETVLKAYDINSKVHHRAVADAQVTLELAKKLNKFEEMIEEK